MAARPSKIAYDLLTAEDDGRVCKDIPESACDEQPKNFTIHLTSLSFTKVADGLIDPKLVLSWLLTTLGAPAFFIALLVPVREAGALLPQLFTAAHIRAMPVRKIAWAVGSMVQGACAAAIALSALWLEGAALGWTVVSLLALLAVARSVCSVAYKDVLGKTVSKSRRGTATGTASSFAAGAVLCFAVALTFAGDVKLSLVTAALGLAGLLWIFAGFNFLRLTEEAGATEGGGNPMDVVRQSYRALFEDAQLRRFILVRGLLTATALAPPFMVALGADVNSGGYGQLGLLVLASGGAGLLSGYVWGRLADHSSRKVLIYSGVMGAVALGLTVAVAQLGLAGTPYMLPGLLFLLMLGYNGVRLGRSTHLVDMANADQRAIYTALSNSIIGVILLAAGGLGWMVNAYGEELVIALMAVMCLLASLIAMRLEEVQ